VARKSKIRTKAVVSLSLLCLAMGFLLSPKKANATVRCIFDVRLPGGYRVIRANGEVSGSCWPSDVVVKDKKGNDIITLVKAVMAPLETQLRKGHLLFWYGRKKISEEEETSKLFVTNLKTFNTETVWTPSRTKQTIVSPNAKKIAFLYDNIDLLLVYDLENKEAKKIEKRRLDKSNGRCCVLGRYRATVLL
jgi:hypothetical protein